MSNKKNNKQNTGIPKAFIEENLPLSGTTGTTGGSVGVNGTMADANINNTSTRINDDATKLFLGGVDANEALKLAENLSKVLSNQKGKDDESEGSFRLTFNFGKEGGKLSKQLKAQGYKLDKHFVDLCEQVRISILVLSEFKFIKKKQRNNMCRLLTQNIGEEVCKKYYGKAVSFNHAK
jgi:hypothetical protein